MGKVKTLQSSLNGGEITPKLWGRPELPRCGSGLERCDNFIPFVLGGATVRPGTRMVAPALLDENGQNNLDIYTALDDAGLFRGFAVEMNATQARAFKALAVADTFTNVMSAFSSKASAQFEDHLYMVAGTAAPVRMQRVSDNDWSMEVAPFVAQPFMRPPNTEDITIAPSALSGSITLVASAAFFVAGHVGLKMKVNGGIVQITAVTNSTHATADVVEAIPAPTGVSTKEVRFNIAYDPPMSEGIFSGSAFSLDCTATANFETDALTSSIPGMPDGLSITTFNSTVMLTGTEPDKDWTEQAWSTLRGWPVAVGFFEQRMILAGSKTYPTTVWGSKSGKPLDYTLGTDDDSAFAWKLAAANTPIRSIICSDRIYVFTATKEISIDSGNEKALSATNFKIKTRSNQGASYMPPVMLSSDTIFASITSNRLYSLMYRLDSDRFVANDITIYGEHLIREAGGIVQVAVTREPHPILWCRTAIGTLITLTHDTEQQVSAWARIVTDGTVKNLAAGPDASGNDQVWLTVERNGAQYIEVMDWTLQTDSAVTGTDAIGKTVWDGLDHLEGKAVHVVADGYVVRGLTVQGGQITLPYPAKSVEIGLPFTGRLKDLPFAFPGSTATISQAASLNEIKVLLDSTKGCQVNGERIPFQAFGDNLLDKPVQSFSGWKTVGALGWGQNGAGGQVEIVRDLPLPCTVMAIVKEITING